MLRFFCRSSAAFLSLFAFILVCPTAPAAADVLSLQKTAPFEQNVNVPDAIRAGCGLESKLIDFVESSAGEDYEKILLVDQVTPTAQGQALAITITDLSGASGGGWSGPKHLSIAGTLWKDGKIVGTFTANRVSSSAPGEYHGTCRLLARCARSLGKDVAGWLKNPSVGSVLGDVQ